MNRLLWLGACVVLGWPALAHGANIFDRYDLDRANRRIKGHVVDYSRNHGTDRRIWSPALCQHRDLYVYLPPCYDPCQRYPIMLWLHGFAQDEHSFLNDVVPLLDQAIASGKLPPLIVAAPDGSLYGHSCLLTPGSFFINTKAGAFEDFLMKDVWGFLLEHYPIRPEPEAHILAGVSMGGGSAFNLGMKYRHCFKVVLGIFPPLNSRWVDCKCNYMSNFDPCCWGWRSSVKNGKEVVGRFFGLGIVRLKHINDDLYGRGADAIPQISMENPIEMLDRLNLQEGELCMYVAYGGKDQFNIDAQVESFLYRARCRGLTVAVAYNPRGGHDRQTARGFFPGIVTWLAPLIAPYSPGCAACPAPCLPAPEAVPEP